MRSELHGRYYSHRGDFDEVFQQAHFSQRDRREHRIFLCFHPKTCANIVLSPQDTTHTPDYYNPIFDTPIDHGTVRYFTRPIYFVTYFSMQSHISIVDKDGMAIAITSTVNLIFGSQVLDPITGILFNDEVGSPFRSPGRELTIC